MPNYEKKVKIVGTEFVALVKYQTSPHSANSLLPKQFFQTLSLIFKIKNYVFQKFAIFLYLQM